MPAARCNAWAQGIVRYWRALQERGALDSAAPLDVMGLLSDRGESVRPLLHALIAHAAADLRQPPRLRYLACFPDLSGADEWGARAENAALVESGMAAPAVWRAGSQGPWLAGGEHAGRAWRPANPSVVLMHDVLQRLPQRLLAVHYGTLLEAELALGSSEPLVDDETLWRPVSPTEGEACCPSCGEYLADLNSAPLIVPQAAVDAIRQLHTVTGHACLVLAASPGVATRRSLRLMTFPAILDRYRMDGTLPVNFEMLSGCWQRASGAVWHREIAHGWVVHAALGSALAGVVELDDCMRPLSDGDHGDLPELVSAMAAVARYEGEATILALLRSAHFDRAVFAAACPALHARLLRPSVCDPAGWRQALRAVWAQCIEEAGSDRAYRDLARCAMRIADWPLAKQAWQRGIDVHGRDADDLVELAWCHLHTGQLPQAARLLDHAGQLDAGRPCVRELAQTIARRFNERNSEWGHVIGVPPAALVLESLDVLHLDALKVQYRDPQIAVMAMLPPLPSVADASAWFEQDFKNPARKDYAVMHAERGFVGHVALELSGDCAYFLFWIGVDHQGHGFATQAGRMLCDFARARGLRHVFTSCFEDNARSIAALPAIGFRRLDVRGADRRQARVHYHLPLSAAEDDDPAKAFARFDEGMS